MNLSMFLPKEDYRDIESGTVITPSEYQRIWPDRDVKVEIMGREYEIKHGDSLKVRYDIKFLEPCSIIWGK